MIRFPVFPVVFFVLCVLLLQVRIHLDKNLIEQLPDLPQTPFADRSLGQRNLVNPRLERQLRRGTERCPDLQRPAESEIRTRHEVWQYHESDTKEEVVVYSAFFDDRPLLDLSTWIRILGVASIPSKQVFCYVWYDGYTKPYVIAGQLNVTGREHGYRYGNRSFIQYLISCQLPGVEPVPSHVSLVTVECNQSSIFLPVQRPIRSTPDQEFGICVPISFGTLSTQDFVEWIELNRLFGVTEFNVYDANMTGMSDVFDYYSTRGLLRVFRTPPAVNLLDLGGVKLGSVVALNDCMMRNLYRYRMIIVIDFDEFIIPRIHNDYSSMLAHVDKAAKQTERYQGYAFRNAYFFRELAADATEPSYMRTAFHRLRSALKKEAVSPKSFVDPRFCLSVFNHYCLLQLKPGKLRSIDVHPSLAVTHHYRICGFSKPRCAEYYNASYRDDTGLRFKDRVLPRVKLALKELRVLP